MGSLWELARKQWLHLWGLTSSRLHSIHSTDGIENYFKPFLVFTYAFTSLITWWTNDKMLCFVATCIPVKVIFQKQSLELDPTTSKMTCDSRDLHTWARSYWRPLKCWNRPNFAMLSLKCKGTCAKIRWVKLEQLSGHGAAPALNNHSCFYDAESAVIRHQLASRGRRTWELDELKKKYSEDKIQLSSRTRMKWGTMTMTICNWLL